MGTLRSILCLLPLTMFAATPGDAMATSGAVINSVGVPPGFEELSREQQLFVDVYFGGQKVGSTSILAAPGQIRFSNPDELLRLIPNLKTSEQLRLAASTALPSNVSLVCRSAGNSACGELAPEHIGLIFDEDRFRIDLFVNPRYLREVGRSQERYLAIPSSPLSLTTGVGLALSGSGSTGTAYNLQNRTVVGMRNARFRSDISYASTYGLISDSAVAELDVRNLRYSAGLFWAPGIDLTGQRRILGVGLTTQLDTTADQDSIRGTPLVLFLSQASTVDVLVDGRLMSSASYDAGNNVLDTSRLPDGTYPVILRIRERSGAERQERRFFSRFAQIAPMGRPVIFAYAGVLANTRRRRPISLSNRSFYQLGVAKRINERTAIDFSVAGSGGKPVFEVGGWFVTPFARVRAAGLMSPLGDHGGLVQVASAASGRLNLNFDARIVRSHDGKPLLPLTGYVSSFADVDQKSFDEAASYLQASGSLGYSLGSAYLSVIGSLRKTRGYAADYSVGPNFNMPLISRNGLQLALQADAQITRQSISHYVGLRIQLLSARHSISSVAGIRRAPNGSTNDAARVRVIGDTAWTTTLARGDSTDASLTVGVADNPGEVVGHAEAIIRTSLASGRANIARAFGGNEMQYSLSFQTGAVANRQDISLGARNLSESAVIVHVDGRQDDSEYEVLIDEQVKGRLQAGDRLPIFLQPYRSYYVRLRAKGAVAVTYDTAVRKFTLYPGNVQPLRWKVERVATVFGRALNHDGKPVADATVRSARGVGQSNSQGYFQVETGSSDQLRFSSGKDASCVVAVDRLDVQKEFVSLGDVLCR